MAFEDVTFPDDISYGSVGGPGYDTAILRTDGQIEQASSRRDQSLGRYNVKYGIKTVSQLARVIEFFHAMRGAAISFRFKDWSDYATTADHVTHTGQSVTNLDVQIMVGDGVTSTCQLIKRYTKGTITRTRNIYHPVGSSLIIAVDGADWSGNFSVNETTGIVTFTSIPAAGKVVTAGFEYDVEVRFAKETESNLPVSIDAFDVSSLEDIVLEERLSTTPANEEFFFGGAKTFSPMTTHQSLTLGDGRVIVANPQSNNLAFTLPAVTNLQPGGPYWYIFNDNAGANNLVIRDQALATIATIAPQQNQVVLLAVDTGGSKYWRVL